MYQNGVFKRDQEERILRKAIHQKLDDTWKPAYENAVIQWLQSEVDFEPFKQHGEDNWINVKNGMLNIETSELVPHDPSFRSIIQLPINYDLNISPEIAKTFLLGIIPKHAEDTFWEYLGTIHDTQNTYRKSLFLIGRKRSGKSTVIEIIEICISSEYCSHENPMTLSTDRFAAASLYGKLLNTDSELELTQAMLVGMFKKTTAASDTITAQQKFGQPFTFKPYAKHIYAANDYVSVAGSDTAFHDRIITIHCQNTHELDIRYQAHRVVTEEFKSSFLNASLEGLRRLRVQNGKFSISAELLQKAKEHRVLTDTVISWLLEHTEEDQNAAIVRSSLYTLYEEDNDTAGQRRGIVSKKNFFSRIEDNQDLLNWEHDTKNIYDSQGNKISHQEHIYIGRRWKNQKRASLVKDNSDKWVLAQNT